MTVYNINLAIGAASSGVEYAQLYRAQIFRKANIQSKFIFLELVQSENIQSYTNKIGFLDEEIISLYNYFTDIKIAPTTYTINDLLNTLDIEITNRKKEHRNELIYFNNNEAYVRCFPSMYDNSKLDRAEFVYGNMLIRKDFFTYTKTYTEYYAPKDNKAVLYMRKFYNEDGSEAYREYIDGNSHIFHINDEILYSWQEFISYFMKKLNVTSDDILILDRSTNVGQAIISSKGNAKLGVVVHAEHYSENATNDEQILWNNFYEYQFSNASHIDFFITATEHQKQVLASQFQKYNKTNPRIFDIPVGSIEQIKKPKNNRQPYSIITASRLATEKHIDWIVRTVIAAKLEIPEITLDIYGEGGERQKIQAIINENNAQDYIKLNGHVDLNKVYPKYELFISASTSEGFGLTLLEAVGSGLGMIGLDVKYGNTTFIHNDVNGYRIPFEKGEDTQLTVSKMKKAIINYYKNSNRKEIENNSYQIAEAFTSEKIKNKWIALIDEVIK